MSTLVIYKLLVQDKNPCRIGIANSVWCHIDATEQQRAHNFELEGGH